MALITRVSRLFRADVNAVLDRMEEPEILLKQAIREMEEELSRDEQKAKLNTLELTQLSLRQNEVNQQLKETSDELDLCFNTGNETLARTMLKRRLEAERVHKFLSRKQVELQNTHEELNKRIDDNRSRLESMKQKAELFADSTEDVTQSSAWNEPDFMRQFTVSEDDIEIAYLREKQRRAQS